MLMCMWLGAIRLQNPWFSGGLSRLFKLEVLVSTIIFLIVFLKCLFPHTQTVIFTVSGHTGEAVSVVSFF